jgi:hypothetical protein
MCMEEPKGAKLALLTPLAHPLHSFVSSISSNRQCGFHQGDKDHSSIDDVMGLHVRKLPYKFIRLKTGTGITMMATTEHARMCSVVQYGYCNADKTVWVMS